MPLTGEDNHHDRVQVYNIRDLRSGDKKIPDLANAQENWGENLIGMNDSCGRTLPATHCHLVEQEQEQ